MIKYQVIKHNSLYKTSEIVANYNSLTEANGYCKGLNRTYAGGPIRLKVIETEETERCIQCDGRGYMDGFGAPICDVCKGQI